MSKMAVSLYEIRQMDEFANKKTVVHSLHPLSKLLVAMFFIIAVVSFPKYAVGALLPFFLYPVIIMTLGDIPAGMLLKKLLFALPFVVGVGIFNPLFDTQPLLVLPHFSLSAGWISFFSILLKCALTVTAAILLLATTGMTGIGFALRLLKVPRLFVTQLLLTYRYISVLMEEAMRMQNGYSLRNNGKKGIQFANWGNIAGMLLIRTSDRAERIYKAMSCRGYNGDFHAGHIKGMRMADLVFLFSWLAFFLVARLYDIPALLGNIMTGAIV